MAPKTGRSKELQVATRDYTLNMHKRLQGIAFKKRATRAVRECARFAANEMHTKVSSFLKFVASLSFLHIRMLEWIPLWTISSGPEVLETSQDLSESESPERRTRKMMPKLLSIQPSNSSKLNHLLASKPKTDEYAKTDDQSNSCFILINIVLIIYYSKLILRTK